MAADERMTARFSGRRVGIWGFRAEGVAALEFVQRFGPASITVVDDKEAGSRLDELARRATVPIVGPFTGADAAEHLRDCDVVVKSAGVSRYRDAAVELVAGGTELVGGMQLFFESIDPARLIGVTGTKGKSTTTTAIHRILVAAGCRAELLGNMGRPVLEHLGELAGDDSFCVVEVSSYQASEITRSPALGCLTSLYPDHLDWHGSLDRYLTDKVNLFGHPAPATRLHVGPQAIGHPLVQALPVDRVGYGDTGRVRVDGDAIVLDGEELTRGSRLQIPGRHNLVNLCGAVSVAVAAFESRGGTVDAGFRRAAAGALESLEPLPNRLEVVGVVDGVAYTVDVLATIPQATIAALDAHADRPVVLIAGGHDRGQDYGELADFVAGSPNVAGVVGLPDTGPRLTAAVRAAVTRAGRDDLSVVDADDLPHAVAVARGRVEAGGTVLLSPAAASFNRYLDYAALSAHFREIVGGLGEGLDDGSGGDEGPAA